MDRATGENPTPPLIAGTHWGFADNKGHLGGQYPSIHHSIELHPWFGTWPTTSTEKDESGPDAGIKGCDVPSASRLPFRSGGALLTETIVESGTSQSKSGISVNLSNSGEQSRGIRGGGADL